MKKFYLFKGDHGAPLICDIDGVATVSGVFQWGPGDFWKKDCSRSGFPAVYTNIYNLRTWVDDLIQNVPPPERVENYRIYLYNSQITAWSL